MGQAAGLRLPHAASAKRADRMLAVLKSVNAGARSGSRSSPPS